MALDFLCRLRQEQPRAMIDTWIGSNPAAAEEAAAAAFERRRKKGILWGCVADRKKEYYRKRDGTDWDEASHRVRH